MEGSPAYRTIRNDEEKSVMAVYACITGRIVTDQLLSSISIQSTTLIRIIELCFLVGIAWHLYKIIKSNGCFKYRGWPLILIILLAVCNLYIVVRGNYGGGLKNMVLNKTSVSGIPAYILPFIILFLPNKKYLSSILETLSWSVFLILPIWLLNLPYLVQDKYFGEAIGCYLPIYAILLLPFVFRNPFFEKKNLFIILIYLIYLFIMVLNARRNMVVSLTLFLFIAFIIGRFSFLDIRKTILYLAGLVVSLALVLSTWGIMSTTIFDRLLYRGFEDSRSGVELLFLADLSSSSTSDWVVGRGIDGTYAQVTQNDETLEVSSDRELIETGYLHMILKGGLIYVLLFVVFSVTAILKGFASNKRFIRGLSYFLLVYLLDMYMTNAVAYFSVKATVFWLIISIILQLKTVPEHEGSL